MPAKQRRALDPQVNWLGPEAEINRARAAAVNRRVVSRDEHGNLVIPPRDAGAAYTQT